MELEEEKKEEIKYFTIANLFTCMNISSGFMAVVVLFLPMDIKYILSGIFILLGAAFDAADGYVARVRAEASEFGKQLDSLADMVSFGVAPALLLIHKYAGEISLGLAVSGLVYILCGAIRLARFNIIDTADGNIKGLPVTVSGVIISLKIIVDSLFRSNIRPEENMILMIVLGVLMLCKFILKKLGYRSAMEGSNEQSV